MIVITGRLYFNFSCRAVFYNTAVLRSISFAAAGYERKLLLLITIEQLFKCYLYMVNLEINQTFELAETFGLLADTTRLSIVLECMDREVSAGEIANSLNVSPSLVSHHLRLLRSARIVRSERRGKQVFYTMTDVCVQEVLTTMINHLFVHDHLKTKTENEGEAA